MKLHGVQTDMQSYESAAGKLLNIAKLESCAPFCAGWGCKSGEYIDRAVFPRPPKSRPRLNHTSRPQVTQPTQLLFFHSRVVSMPAHGSFVFCSSVPSYICLGTFTISSSAASSGAKTTFGFWTEKMLLLGFCSASTFWIQMPKSTCLQHCSP